MKKPIRDSLIHHSGNGKFAIREKNWKLIKGLGSGGYTLPVRIIPKKGYPKGQLYDLDRDPYEKNNLWHEEPERVDHLLKLLNKIKKKA
jgi:hypothetical protein